MAKYTTAGGERYIMAENGYGWVPQDGSYVRWAAPDDEGPIYTLEKRRRNPKDETHTTGWYLYDDKAGGFFGEFCSARILEAVDEAGDLIKRAEQVEAQHEVTAPAQLDDEDVWDEPRAELAVDEVFRLRAGVVVEAHTLAGVRVRIRLAAQPSVKTVGAVALEGTAGERHEVRPESVTLIGVMPRKGDTIHAQAKTYSDGPDGERIIGRSKVMRRKLDRAPWPGNEGQLVVSDGRGVDMVLTSTIVILADAPDKRTDEQRVARAVQLAMPGLDFHTNTTSTSAIRVYAKRAEHEGRDDEAVLARNDDIAEAIALAGLYVSRRGVGQSVYASVAGRHGSTSPDDPCEVEAHRGERAPWIAILPTEHPLESVYACRACVARYVEQRRAEQHIDPARPYIVRMWDRAGRALRVAPDASSLDFLGAETEQQAREIAAGLTERGWLMPVQGGDGEHVRAELITIDRGDFETNGNLWKVRRLLQRPPGSDFERRGPRCVVGACRAEATRVHRWVDKGYTPPAPKAEPKCLAHGERGVANLGGTLHELDEAHA